MPIRDYDLLDRVPAGIFAFRDDGELVAVNDTLVDLLGYPRGELVGFHVERILGIAGRIFYQTHLFPLLRMQGVAEEIYLELRSREGGSVPVLLNARREEAAGEPLSHCVAMRVHERKKYEDELLRAKKAAEEAHARELAANEAKSHYLRSVSHEVRTPINAMLGYADLLELNPRGALGETELGYIERVRQAARHLLHLVNDVLDLAKVESGAMTVDDAPHDVAAAFDAALSLIEPQAAERGVDLQRRESHDSGRYLGDHERVIQVLVNLLSNAVKFTGPGGRVAVGWSRVEAPDPGVFPDDGGPWLAVRVEDTGVGIEPDRIRELFQPFKQGVDSGGETRPGTGLGLAISREFARLMGGDISVRSEPGKGSEFSLWLRAGE